MYHVTPVPSNFHRRRLDHVRPTHRMPSWHRQPATVFRFLPSLSFRSTPPQLCTIPRHRPASPFSRCAVWNPHLQQSPKLPVFASVCVRENLAWCAALFLRGSRWNTTSFLGSVRRCTVGHHGRHVAPTSEFHEGVRPAQEVRQPSPERGPCTVALLDFCDAWMKRRAFLRLLVRQLVRLQPSQRNSCLRAHAALSRDTSPIPPEWAVPQFRRCAPRCPLVLCSGPFSSDARSGSPC